MPKRNEQALDPQATGASVVGYKVKIWEPPKGQTSVQSLNTDTVPYEMVRHLISKRSKKRGTS